MREAALLYREMQSLQTSLSCWEVDKSKPLKQELKRISTYFVVRWLERLT